MRLGLALVVSSLLLSACSRSPPPMAEGIPDSLGPTSKFDDRVRQLFPVGSPEGALLVDLRNQRFAISETRDANGRLVKTALYEDQYFPCNERWTIEWHSDHEKIEDISGTYSGKRCL